MKTLKFFAVLFGLSVIFSLLTSIAHAAATPWPGDYGISPNERVQIMSHQIAPNVAVNWEAIIYESLGVAPAHLVYRNISIRNGHGEVLGSATPSSTNSMIRVDLRRTVVLPSAPTSLYLEGEVLPGLSTNVLGKPVILMPRATVIEGRTNWLEDNNDIPYFGVTRDTNAIGGLQFVQKYGASDTVQIGQRSLLGAFMVGTTGAEGMTNQMRFGVHTSGGFPSDIWDVFAVLIQFNGQIYYSGVYQEQNGDYVTGSLPFLRGDVGVVGIIGIPGDSFRYGGSIALSANPSDWKAYGTISRKELALTGKTVTGHAMWVQQTQDVGGGAKGSDIPPPAGDLK